jgi:hypothetical protein
MILPDDLSKMLKAYMGKIVIPESRTQLLELSLGGKDNMTFDVCYDLPDGRGVREAYITKCKNGIVANYDEPYMRRRDPDTMVIADGLPTDKITHKQRFGTDFAPVRAQTFDWLKSRPELILMPFMSGNDIMNLGYPSLLIIPANAAFFALALSDLQGFILKDNLKNNFKPKAIVYVAPPFRHTHYDGKQIVVHNRQAVHEVFSYNLYPGPSAKKGIYAVLLDIGEQEHWVTLHASTVTCITPYELTLTIMHEGASGAGKSEMLEQFHREPNGKLLLGTNILNDEKYYLSITDSCTLNPVTDDMAEVHPALSNEGKKLVVVDAEEGWFLRVNHITEYGTEPEVEKRTIHPEKPLIFFNIAAQPGSTCLMWEHIPDAPNKPCPNPRFVLPRTFSQGHIDTPVEVDIRSFGIRTPPCTAQKPDYGIIGLFHVLPPALAWLWRLASPRGHDNPSIVGGGGLQSEGVGSYWPFATGKFVDQANLLLNQILNTLSTRYVLIPNQHIGAYKVGFSGQWAVREYLSRRGGTKFKPDAITKSRCPLLGYVPENIKIDATPIAKGLLQVNLQPEVGNAGYDKGAKILTDFFKREVKKYLSPNLLPLGKNIIEACLSDAGVDDYYNLIPKL